MRRLLNFLVIVFACLFISCQIQVPKDVRQAFEKHYPDEKSPKWNIDRNNNFEAQFKKDGENYRADFTPQGKWIETERSIKKKDLPKVIRQRLKSEYSDFKIVELEETLHHKKGLFYDVELKKDGKKRDVEFSTTGEILN